MLYHCKCVCHNRTVCSPLAYSQTACTQAQTICPKPGKQMTHTQDTMRARGTTLHGADGHQQRGPQHRAQTSSAALSPPAPADYAGDAQDRCTRCEHRHAADWPGRGLLRGRELGYGRITDVLLPHLVNACTTAHQPLRCHTSSFCTTSRTKSGGTKLVAQQGAASTGRALNSNKKPQ